METETTTTKISRRTAKACKAALTRSGELINNIIEGKRPNHEVRVMLDELQTEFTVNSMNW